MTTPIQQQRHIELEGTTNLRNLGGYTTADGSKRVRWGCVYRCDQLADVPAEAAQRVLVGQLHVRETFDFRDPGEVAQKPYNIPHITRHSVPCESTAMQDYAATGKPFTADAVAAIFEDIYTHFTTQCAGQFGKVLKAIAAARPDGGAERGAVLVHCTAGKDRTGICCYLLLSVLGVREEDKVADYLATNQHFKIPAFAGSYLGGLQMDEAAMQVMWTVQERFLDVARAQFAKAGGVDAYARAMMGLTDEEIAALRECLLE